MWVGLKYFKMYSRLKFMVLLCLLFLFFIVVWCWSWWLIGCMKMMGSWKCFMIWLFFFVCMSGFFGRFCYWVCIKSCILFVKRVIMLCILVKFFSIKCWWCLSICIVFWVGVFVCIVKSGLRYWFLKIILYLLKVW